VRAPFTVHGSGGTRPQGARPSRFRSDVPSSLTRLEGLASSGRGAVRAPRVAPGLLLREITALPVPVLEHRNFPESSKPVKNCKVGFCRGWLTFYPVKILDRQGRANAALFYSGKAFTPEGYCLTSYSKATPSGSCCSNHVSAVRSLAKTFRCSRSPTCLVVST
jgi:hypothetical protein